MPGDFREFFDARRLDEQRRGNLEFVLNSPAYTDYFEPFIQGVLNHLNSQWKDRSRERQEKYNDDFLAGGVIFGEAMLAFFKTIITETSIERMHSAMENMTPEMLYDLKRQRGQGKPVINLDQPALPTKVDPDEDY